MGSTSNDGGAHGVLITAEKLDALAERAGTTPDVVLRVLAEELPNAAARLGPNRPR